MKISKTNKREENIEMANKEKDENILEVRNLNKDYKGFKLKDINLTLPKGMIMGLIGENGAGKTTTIKSILNLTKVDSGEVKIFGLNIKEDEKKIKKILKNSAMTIQKDAISNLTKNGSVKTGHLRRGVANFRRGMTATVHTSNIKYAVMVEKGTKAHIIKPKDKKALYWKGAKHPVKQVNHPGSKAKPYLIPAFEKETPYFLKKLEEAIEW